MEENKKKGKGGGNKIKINYCVYFIPYLHFTEERNSTKN